MTGVPLGIGAVYVNADLAVSGVLNVHVIPTANAVGVLGQWDMNAPELVDLLVNAWVVHQPSAPIHPEQVAVPDYQPSLRTYCAAFLLGVAFRANRAALDAISDTGLIALRGRNEAHVEDHHRLSVGPYGFGGSFCDLQFGSHGVGHGWCRSPHRRLADVRRNTYDRPLALFASYYVFSHGDCPPMPGWKSVISASAVVRWDLLRIALPAHADRFPSEG